MKENPKGIMGVRIIVGGFGLLWTIFASIIIAGSHWTIVDLLFPGFGILFIIVAFTLQPGKDSSSGDEESTAGKTETTLQQERPAAPREKKTVFCPYCGTAQKEDYRICDSCGAGRKRH